MVSFKEQNYKVSLKGIPLIDSLKEKNCMRRFKVVKDWIII